MKNKKHCTAIVLSAGQGKRMGASVQKQYIELEGKPVIYYTIKAFQDSEIIDDIVLVVGKDQDSYVKEEIVEEAREYINSVGGFEKFAEWGLF